MHKKIHDSILLLSRRCKYIIKATNTLLNGTNLFEPPICGVSWKV